ncbi:MAG: dTDP-4-dehydrorhamnose reductase [Betaproteobacteria bacterium TMED82]|nr:MAG: dTDP-4-dehydrorhamnose reductase [Betaproteobacteria bacterium TMED82]|tara:strand:- start:17680 stop:18582 length:903 start_codon:yes stop_codon:yes gene_type:complete
MKILLLGRNGQVGKSIYHKKKRGQEIRTVGRETLPFDDGYLLLKNFQLVLMEFKPDVVVNAIAYTNVDQAEEEKDLAFKINGFSLEIIASVIRKFNKNFKPVTLIHFSTDYVFDGSGTKPWVPSDIPKPLNTYGHSKLYGEQVIISADIPFIILRISWIYSIYSKNFLLSIFKRIKDGGTLRVVSDQIGTPTSATFVSEFCHHLFKNFNYLEKTGVYHLSPKGVASWFDFANYILLTLKKGSTLIQQRSSEIRPILSKDYSTMAKRPKNSRLDSTLLVNSFDFEISSWKTLAEREIKKLI